MTITVQLNGTTVSGITWYTMTPWSATVKYLQHEIDGADYDVYHVTGLNSPTATLTGVYRRSTTNDATVESLKGQTLTITDQTGTTRSGICLDATPNLGSGGLFVTVSMTVVEQ